MHNKQTPAQELLDVQVSALVSEAERCGISGFDPYERCKGVRWIRDRIAEKPDMTADELRIAFVEAGDAGKGAWALGALRHQYNLLYPEFVADLVTALSAGQAKIFHGGRADG